MEWFACVWMAYLSEFPAGVDSDACRNGDRFIRWRSG